MEKRAAAIHLQKKKKICLFSRFERRGLRAPSFKPCINIVAALPAVEFRSAGALDTACRLRAFGSGSIDLGRINIIADAMYHQMTIASCE